METQVSNEIVAFIFKTQKLTSSLLQEAMKATMLNEAKNKNGLQPLKNLEKKGCALQHIEITDQNIGKFTKTAKKYNIDFALKKDTSDEVPRYLVFFKSPNQEIMQKAFNEFSYNMLHEKPSIIQQLKEMNTITLAPVKARELEKVHTKEPTI